VATAILAGLYYMERDTSLHTSQKSIGRAQRLNRVIYFGPGGFCGEPELNQRAWRAAAGRGFAGQRTSQHRSLPVVVASALLACGWRRPSVEYSIGIAMVVLVLESARARSDELNDKSAAFAAHRSQHATLSVRDVLEQVSDTWWRAWAQRMELCDC